MIRTGPSLVFPLLVLLVLAASCSRKEPPRYAFRVPVESHKLDNGLRVVLSPDDTAPTVVVAVYYHIGFRNEPRGRTGFAHLFEHMMFQGSENLGKMEFIQLVQSNGGVLNGSTRFDFTNYFELVPSHKLETMLWAEADRMRGLKITRENLVNQKAVVKNEVKVNVLNRPYGGFPFIDLPMAAFTNWHNAHNFYGDMTDLDAATLEDVAHFFHTYYAPNNAVLVVAGDFEPARAMEWIRKYFGGIPRSDVPAPPDVSEPRQEKERRVDRTDPLATRPALGVAYQMPRRWTPEYFAMGLLDQILLQGNDSLLHQALVQEAGMTGEVQGGINPLGDQFNYEGPMLWYFQLVHDENVPDDAILAAAEKVLARVRDHGVDRQVLDRALVKMRSRLYESIGEMGGFGKADLLASFSLFDDDPGRINHLEERFREVTPELVRRTAREYLRPGARTVVAIHPGKKGGTGREGR